MPSQKILKNNKIFILNNKISIFSDSIISSQKVKPITKLIKILKFSIFSDGGAVSHSLRADYLHSIHKNIITENKNKN